MQVYLAGPIFSLAERAWLDGLASRVRAAGFDCFVPHEHLADIGEPSPDAVYALDATALRASNLMLAWLDGPCVDDGTAVEVGMFAELVRSGGERYVGIVGLVTDLRLERRRGRAPGDGMNLFLGGTIAAHGRICWSLEEAVAALRALAHPGTLPVS